MPAEAETFRMAVWNVELTRQGPGLLLRDIRSGNDPQVEAVAAGLVALEATAILLTSFDYDRDRRALGALADRLAAAGLPYPHRFALRPNTGTATGLDLDGDGRSGGPRDAQGWGRFAGEGGMAILSRLPVDEGAVLDHSTRLWRDLPGAIPPPMPSEVAEVQRLSTTGHWEVPLILPDGRRLTLLAFHASPPVFDGPEDRNGRRNHDEAAFWLHRLAGAFGPPPAAPFILLGTSNLDPADGEGRREAIAALLAHPALQDPAPRGSSGRVEPGHTGDPALDTALFDPRPGGLRVEVLLPSADLAVAGAGILWPPDSDPMAATWATASRHRPVWTDLRLP